MAILTRNIPILNFSIKNLLYALFIIGIIVTLFFIPEIIRFGRRAGLSLPSFSSSERVLNKTKQLELASRSSSPLEQILRELNAPRGEISTVSGSGSATRSKSERDSFIGGGTLTWENLRSDKAEATIARAQTEAQNLIQLTDKKNVYLRQALYRFIAGVDFVNSEADRTMTAREAANHLENLDIGVTEALISSNAPRSHYLRWMDASLTPALQSARAQIFKEQSLQPFNPKLRLFNVELYQVNPPKGRRVRPRTRVTMSGRVIGKDIKKAILLRNGRYLKNIFFDAADDLGLRRFYVASEPAWGTFTFKIWDRKDKLYQKSYRFYPKVQNFKLVNNAYQMPYLADLEDLRIDKVFAYSEKIEGGGDSERGYVTF